MQYRARIDSIFKLLTAYRVAPRPSWRVLLSADGLGKWSSWAEKYESYKSKHPKDELGIHSVDYVWMFQDWESFISFYGDF